MLDSRKAEFSRDLLERMGAREDYVRHYRLIYTVSLAAHMSDNIFPEHYLREPASSVRMIAEDAGGLELIRSALFDRDARVIPDYFYLGNPATTKIMAQAFSNIDSITNHIHALHVKSPHHIFDSTVFLRKTIHPHDTFQYLGDPVTSYFPDHGLELSTIFPRFRYSVEVIKTIINEIYPAFWDKYELNINNDAYRA